MLNEDRIPKEKWIPILMLNHERMSWAIRCWYQYYMKEKIRGQYNKWGENVNNEFDVSIPDNSPVFYFMKAMDIITCKMLVIWW